MVNHKNLKLPVAVCVSLTKLSVPWYFPLWVSPRTWSRWLGCRGCGMERWEAWDQPEKRSELGGGSPHHLKKLLQCPLNRSQWTQKDWLNKTIQKDWLNKVGTMHDCTLTYLLWTLTKTRVHKKTFHILSSSGKDNCHYDKILCHRRNSPLSRWNMLCSTLLLGRLELHIWKHYMYN